MENFKKKKEKKGRAWVQLSIPFNEEVTVLAVEKNPMAMYWGVMEGRKCKDCEFLKKALSGSFVCALRYGEPSNSDHKSKYNACGRFSEGVGGFFGV
jgi:hypothetical protein